MNAYSLATQMPQKATERNSNTTKRNANTTKQQCNETKETLRERFLNVNATKQKWHQTQKWQNGIGRKRNGNFTRAFIELVSFN